MHLPTQYLFIETVFQELQATDIHAGNENVMENKSIVTALTELTV